MISYKDTTFCIAECGNTECDRLGLKYTSEVSEGAVTWWGNEDAPVAVADFSEGCVGFIKVYPDELEMEPHND